MLQNPDHETFGAEGFVNILYDATTETQLPQEPPPTSAPASSLQSEQTYLFLGVALVVDGVRGE